MMILSNIGQMEKGPKSDRKHICSKLLVLVGLGVMVLAICSLLLGCGSDSTPGEALKGKTAKKVGLEGKKSANDKRMGPGASTIAKAPPSSRQFEPAPPGLTLEALQAKIAEQKAAFDRMDPNLIQVSPGMTLKQLQAKTAEQKAAFDRMDPSLIQVSPGMTLKQLQAKIANQQENYNEGLVEVSPGVTVQQVKNKALVEQAHRPRFGPPGVR